MSIALAGACAEHVHDAAPMVTREASHDAAAPLEPMPSFVDAAVVADDADAPPASPDGPDSATTPFASAEAGLDDRPVGACGALARLPGAVGFTGTPCGQVARWVPPTFVYDGMRSAGPAQAVPLKGGDGIIVAAHFATGAPPTYRTVFARVDEDGDCHELIDQVENDDDKHYVKQTRATEHGSLVLTACGYGFCGPSLRLAGRAPYDLLRDVGIDAYLSPTKTPPALFQRIVSARDGHIVVVTGLNFESHDPNRPPELSHTLAVRTLSSDLALQQSANFVADGVVNDVALTDQGEMLVLLDRPNEAASHYLYHFGPALEARGQVYAESRSFDRVGLEAAFGRVAFALNHVVVLDSHTFATSFISSSRPTARFAGFAFFEDGRLLYADDEVLSLHGPDGTPLWSQLIPAAPAGSTASRSVIQVQSGGRIVFSAGGQLYGYCES